MIVTLGTQIVFRGIAEISLGSGGSISLNSQVGEAGYDGFRALATKVDIVPVILFVVVVFFILFAVVLTKTTFGRSLYAMGSNKLSAIYSGIPVKAYRQIVFTVTGFMAGLSAMFLVSTLSGANTTTGSGFEMDAIAMCVFGGISTAGGKGKPLGGFISACIIICLRIGLGQINLNPQLILIILGALLILAVLLPNVAADFKKMRKLSKLK